MTVRTCARKDDLADPRLSPDDCFSWDDECEWAIQSNRKRATAIGYYAREYGIRFQDVVCHRRYMRLLTRQESYEYRALDEAEGNWIDDHDPPLALNADLNWVTPGGTVVELPDELGLAPDDWEPDEEDPVWEWCKKDHPAAIPCWHLEAK